MLAVCVSNAALISALISALKSAIISALISTLKSALISALTSSNAGSAKNSFILLTPAIADCIVCISIPRLSTGANICDM